MSTMCAYFNLSRASYYAWRKRVRQPDRDGLRMALVREAYQSSHGVYGYRRVQMWIEQHKGITINHKAVLRLMNRMGIRSVARKRKPAPKGHVMDKLYRYPNLLNRDFSAERPNQKWVTDMTHIRTQQGWATLCTIKDLYDGFIVAYRFGPSATIQLVAETLRQALEKEMVTDGLILHSDQGHQFRSQAYYVLITAYNLTHSMSRKANCWDNAPMENFFSHLKEEAIRQHPVLPFKEVKQIIQEYIAFFNYERIQLKTKQTPYQQRCLAS